MSQSLLLIKYFQLLLSEFSSDRFLGSMKFLVIDIGVTIEYE